MTNPDFPKNGSFKPKTDYVDQPPLNMIEREELKTNTSKALDELHNNFWGDFRKKIVFGSVKTFDKGYGLRVRDENGDRIGTVYKWEQVRILERKKDVRNSDGINKNFVKVDVYNSRGKIDKKRSWWVAEDFIKIDEKHINDLLKNLEKKIDMVQEPKPVVPPVDKEEPKPVVPPVDKEEPKPVVPPVNKEEPKDPKDQKAKAKKEAKDSADDIFWPLIKEFDKNQEIAKAKREKAKKDFEQLKKNIKDLAQKASDTANNATKTVEAWVLWGMGKLADIVGEANKRAKDAAYVEKKALEAATEKAKTEAEKKDTLDPTQAPTTPETPSRADPIIKIFEESGDIVAFDTFMDTKDIPAIKKLIDSIVKKDKKLLETLPVSMYWNILCTAAAIGNVEIVRYVLDQWVNINSYIADKLSLGTALMNAVYEKRTGVVKLLLEKEADPNICISPKRTPLSDAASLKDKTIYDLLIGARVDFTKTDTACLLVSASHWGNMGILTDLVGNRKMDINASFVDHEWRTVTALWSAIESLNFNVAEYLVDKWAIITPEILALTKTLELDPKSGADGKKFLKKIESATPAPAPVPESNPAPETGSEEAKEKAEALEKQKAEAEAQKKENTPTNPDVQKTPLDKQVDEKIAKIILLFQGTNDKNLTSVSKKLTDFFQKMSPEEKKLFLASTPKIRNLTQKDQLAFLTLFGKQPANKEYALFIDNRDNGQKAYLIDGAGLPKISFDISGGRAGASSPEWNFRILREWESMKEKVDMKPRTKLLKKFGQAYKDQSENGMLDTDWAHAQMTTAILALDTKWDYYLHGTNREQNLWKKDSAWCLRFDNISIGFLSQLYQENGIKWGVRIIKDVWDKQAQWLYNIWASLEKVTEHDIKVKREDFLKNLQAHKNTPYKMGGKDKQGIDCSRLIFESLKPIFGDFSGEICAEDFSRSSQAIEAKDAQIGDFVLLKSDNGIAHHIAVITALSPIKIIGASSSEGKVTESIMNYKNPIFHKNPYIQ